MALLRLVEWSVLYRQADDSASDNTDDNEPPI